MINKYLTITSGNLYQVFSSQQLNLQNGDWFETARVVPLRCHGSGKSSHVIVGGPGGNSERSLPQDLRVLQLECEYGDGQNGRETEGH